MEKKETNHKNDKIGLREPWPNKLCYKLPFLTARACLYIVFCFVIGLLHFIKKVTLFHTPAARDTTRNETSAHKDSSLGNDRDRSDAKVRVRVRVRVREDDE